jgi:hypothetical protein
LTEGESVFFEVGYKVHDFLAVEHGAHVADDCVLADGVLESVEGVVEDALVVAKVGG